MTVNYNNLLIAQNHADPYIRNGRQESPLDLAAQYGRMETVSELSLLLEKKSFVVANFWSRSDEDIMEDDEDDIGWRKL